MEILLEFFKIGHLLRVAALDARSGEEVVFMVPATMAPHLVKRLAARRLRYHLASSARHPAAQARHPHRK